MMKRFTPYLLILTVGFLALTLTASNALAVKCQHMHQLSKILNKQTITEIDCKLCVCEKAETFFLKHKIEASILAECYCDETNDFQCDKWHAHPNSGNGEFEGWGCVWSPDDAPNFPILPPDFTDFQSLGICNDSIFDATITRWVKYCKNATDSPGQAWPRAGYHKGSWKIKTSCPRNSATTTVIARGRLQGVDGVDPSFSRRSEIDLDPDMEQVDNEGGGYDDAERAAHGTLPGGQSNQGLGPDSCESGFPDSPTSTGVCYLAGWQVGCISGRTTDFFFREQCPPPGSYDIDELVPPQGVSDCLLGNDFVINDFRDKQICITPTRSWKLRACYSGGQAINPFQNPCSQWSSSSTEWSVRLEGVIAIKCP